VLYSNAFVIFEAGDEPFVTAKTYTTELVLSDPADVAIYRAVFEQLTASSLDEAATLQYVSELLVGLG
jgi:hypothetical protein